MTLPLLAALALAGCSGDRDDAAAANRPPDVYLIVLDSLRADRLGLYGHDRPTSPQLDAFARDAIVFEQAHTIAPWTLPTVATLMTGHHPRVVGIREKASAVDEGVVTLGELYGDHGYATGAVVSHIYLLKKYGLMQGMDFLDTTNVKDHQAITGKGVTTRALQHLEDHVDEHEEQPLFMLVHYFDVHYDYFEHDDHLAVDQAGRELVPSGQNVSESRKVLRDNQGAQRDLARKRVSELYDSEIRYTDFQLGRLLEGIKEAGRADNALIVIVGDHGEELGDRPSLWIGHTKVVTEEVLRVPLIVRLPKGERPQQRYAQPVSLIDLMPSIAAWSGLPLPEDLDLGGRVLDLAAPDTWTKTLYAETGRWQQLQAAIQHPWKLVNHPASKRDLPELYDLSTDPGERSDVSAAHPEIVEDLSAELATWTTAMEAARSIVLPSEQEPLLDPDEEAALRAMGYIE